MHRMRFLGKIGRNMNIYNIYTLSVCFCFIQISMCLMNGGFLNWCKTFSLSSGVIYPQYTIYIHCYYYLFGAPILSFVQLIGTHLEVWGLDGALNFRPLSKAPWSYHPTREVWPILFFHLVHGGVGC